MNNRIMTMEDLVEFCRTQKTFSFSAKESGHPVVVRTYGHKLEYSSEEDNGLLKMTLKACHTGLNRNGSFISDEDMLKALPSLANKPILAEITENSKGEKDFGTHAVEMVENEDGELEMYYLEKPVGIIPESCNAHLEYDKKEKKNYVRADSYIFRYYGNETASILERRNGSEVSVEIEIEDMHWDAQNNYLVIKDFVFNGVTLLSSDVEPGMKSSRIDISDLAHYSSFDYTKEISDMQARLAYLESNFAIENSKKGGKVQKMNKFEELLAKYNKTIDDIQFDYESLSDEELEEKFKEVFDDNEGANDSESSDPENSENTEGSESDSSDSSTSESESESESSSSSESETPSPAEEGVPSGSISDDDNIAPTSTKKKPNDFALSLQEKINALSNLVSATYEEADNEWYGVIVYDEFVVMIGYFKGQNYKQKYTSENNEYSLVGDRVQVYEQFLTQDEMDALDSMRQEYSKLAEFKASIEQAEIQSSKEALFNDERFSAIRDTDEFNELLNDAEKFSLEEIETKLKVIVADSFLKNQDFTKFSNQPSGKMFTLPSKGTNTVTSKYGGIFTKENK